MKRLTLCADDYAQNPGISHGIRELAKSGRISAVSCFTTTEHWPYEGKLLQSCSGNFDTGLHFNLTHQTGKPLEKWIGDSLRGKLNASEIREALISQWRNFEQVLGKSPDYLDGHQHVHILPGVSEIIADTLGRLGAPEAFPVRRIAKPSATFSWHPKLLVKRAILQFLSQIGEPALSHTYPGNPWFAGIYLLDRPSDFEVHMKNWIRNVPDSTLIMCHPGHRCNDPDDPIPNARTVEYDYLSSDAFEADLRNAHAILVPFRKLIS
ncbi:ChbG/HpnK family deacetylase [Luteolibacter pohnpeiensis]|uniref:ChbG/HpnK family deacetylase n=1 Tax=Luteolibacter pohnpeiensis TaxID=454153 RepID=A0A934S4N0_9BACT|nr:ChbG/HpnK family deacetylase [Luteolibacter pohnpeiensis]MBK1883060.1 ChbG/HpnK family deacetylase [Luteolibacter pohnpeiensis]